MTVQIKCNSTELEHLIILVWSSEWSFDFKRDVANKLMKQWEEIKSNDF